MRLAWRCALLGIGTGAVVLGLLEILFRIFMPQPLLWNTGMVWEPVAGLGWQRKPNLDIRVNTGEREVRVLSDASRHRIGTTPSPEADVKILAVGDSFVEALQVSHEQTMTTLLANALSQALDRRVAVINAGVGGWDPNHYLMVTTDELERSSYDLVLIFIYMENDVVEQRVVSFPAMTKLTSPPLRYGTFTDTIQTLAVLGQAFLLQHSHVYVFGSNQVELRRMQSGTRTQHFLTNVMHSHATSPAWHVTGQILADIATVAAQHHTPVLYILLPSHYYLDEHALAQAVRAFALDLSQIDVGQPARLLTAELAPQGLKVLDATVALRAAFKAGQTNLYGRIDRHFGPVGHQVMARVLEPFVLAHLR